MRCGPLHLTGVTRSVATLKRLVGPGLSDAESRGIEEEYGFEFADDHHAFLAAALPVSEPPEEGVTWESPRPDWRHGGPAKLREHLEWPVEGIVVAVQHGDSGQQVPRMRYARPRRCWPGCRSSFPYTRIAGSGLARQPFGAAPHQRRLQHLTSWSRLTRTAIPPACLSGVCRMPGNGELPGGPGWRSALYFARKPVAGRPAMIQDGTGEPPGIRSRSTLGSAR